MPPSSSISPDTSIIPVPNDLTLSPSAGHQSLPHPTHRALLLHLQSEPDTISQLQETLTTSLASTGWPDRVRALALDLLRSGTCTTFPELLAEVLRRAKIPPPAPPPAPGSSTSNLPPPPTKENINNKETNGVMSSLKKGSAAVANGTHAPAIQRQGSSSSSAAAVDGWLPDVRIPLKTVEEGVAFLKAKVQDAVEVVEPGDLEEQGSNSGDED